MDENITLKLRVTDLEQDLFDEKSIKQSNLDGTVDALKSQVQRQYYESKLRFDEDLLKQKEINYQLKIELAGADERNQVLRQTN